MKKIRAYLYARLSRADEEKIDGQKSESKSIENQIKLLTSYAQKEKLNIEKIYYDDGYSGGNFNRPGFENLMNDVKIGKVDVVIFKDFSRLGRSMHRVGDLIENIFPRYNVRVISVDDNYDSLSFNSDEPIVLKNFLNEYYLKEFKKKLRVVREHSANTKHLNYYPKFGYNFDADGNEIIDKRSAAIVKKIFHLVADDMLSTVRVSEILNSENIPTRSYYATEVLGLKPLHKNQSRFWNAEKVWEIVKDYEYCGHSINWVRHAKEERILLKNTHLAIIDEDLYWRAQYVLEKHSTVKNKLVHLGKIIIDRKSGKNLLYEKDVEPYHTACYFLRINGLRVYKIDARSLENIIIKDVLRFIKGCNVDSEKIYNVFKRKLFGNVQMELVDLKNKLAKLNEQYINILEQSFIGKIEKKLFDKESSKLLSRINETEELIHYHNNKEAEIEILKIKFKRFISSLKNLPIDKIELVKYVVDKIFIESVDKKKFELTIRYKFEL